MKREPLRALVQTDFEIGDNIKVVLKHTHKQIAVDVGYESEAAFTCAFKREFGLPPAQYRKKVAGTNVSLRKRAQIN